MRKVLLTILCVCLSFCCVTLAMAAAYDSAVSREDTDCEKVEDVFGVYQPSVH